MDNDIQPAATGSAAVVVETSGKTFETIGDVTAIRSCSA